MSVASIFRSLVPPALVALLGGCSLATPFKRMPEGRAHAGTVIVGVTNAVVDAKDREAFDLHTRRVIKSLPDQAGLLGYSVRSRVLGNEVWTMTIWRDEEALDAFVRSPIHREAMREGTPQVLTARFDRFEWPSLASPPGWSYILTRLESADIVDYEARRQQATRPPGY